MNDKCIICGEDANFVFSPPINVRTSVPFCKDCLKGLVTAYLYNTGAIFSKGWNYLFNYKKGNDEE